MVTGLDKFREYFAGHEDQYAIIGGTACDLLFDEAGLDFRRTKDIDMVLCVEVVGAEFATAFKRFVEAGGYKVREKSSGKKEFYRFINPDDKTFPHMIEIFSRAPGSIDLKDDARLTPIPVEDDIASLSAILLDEVYFDALQTGKRTLAGVTIIDHTILIPFKALAYLRLKEMAAAGESVDSSSIKKHRNDVFRLAQLLQVGEVSTLADSITNDLRTFLKEVAGDESLSLKDLGLPFSRDDAVALLRTAYGI